MEEAKFTTGTSALRIFNGAYIRALVWLSSSGITNSYNHAQAEDALRSAAYTYVVAALGSLATLVYYIMIFMGRRD